MNGLIGTGNSGGGSGGGVYISALGLNGHGKLQANGGGSNGIGGGGAGGRIAMYLQYRQVKVVV